MRNEQAPALAREWGSSRQIGGGLYSGRVVSETDAPELRQRLVIEKDFPLGFAPDPFTVVNDGKRSAGRSRAILDGSGSRFVFQESGNDAHAGPPRFRPNNPFWIDNVRASLAALVTMNSARRLLKC